MGAILRYVLGVARLGEVDLRGWWGTHSFGPVGRVVLKQRLPRTWRMAAVEIDIAAATNRHNQIMDRSNAVHLFSDTWLVRRWATAWVSEQKTAAAVDPIFRYLESATSDDLVAWLTDDQNPTPPSPIGQAVRIGTVSKSHLDSPEHLIEPVKGLAAIYAGMSVDFAVPYFEVTG